MQLSPENILERAGVKPTPNRILVVKALRDAESPLSLIEIETRLETLDRSSILRVLTLLHANRLVHIMEDGRGISKYELCHAHDHCSTDDMHVHFYCNVCGRTYCFEDTIVPPITLPEGYRTESVNYMLKGVCPHCSKP